MPVKPVVAVEAAEADPEKLDSFFGGDDTSKAAEEEAAYVRGRVLACLRCSVSRMPRSRS